MSAIFGIINKSGEPIAVEKAKAMQDAMLHLAIDGKGIWKNGNTFLGHHQLKAAYRQENEVLPFEDEHYVITSDARIDNHIDVISRLGFDKRHPDVATDGRLILQTFKKWGEQCVDYLEGEFAFCIWNKLEGKLFCATDHIGFRPLFYYDAPDCFIFSSNMKGILAVKDTPNNFNEEILINYFFRQSHHTKTYNKEIYSLCGGNKIIVSNTEARIQKYWEPKERGKYNFIKDSDWAGCLRELLIEAVANQIQTDRPIGIGLSGGLDSSSIACIAARILEKRNKPLYAFSSVLPLNYQGIETDERKYISIVGKHLKNLEHIYVEAPDTGPFDKLEEAFEMEDTLPNAFFYMDRAICSAAEGKNIRVLLSGFGGDHLVSVKGAQIILRLVKKYHWIDAAKLLMQFSRNEKHSLPYFLKREIFCHTRIYKYIKELKYRGQTNWQFETTLNDDFVNTFRKDLNFTISPASQSETKKSILSGETSRYLTMFANRNAFFKMGSAVPLLDRNLLDFMMDVPLKQFVLGGHKRSLIRHAMEGILPSEIQWRQDKLPYAPDYKNRLLNEKIYVQTLMNNEKINHAFRYINKSKILEYIGNVKPNTGITNSGDVSAIRIIQGVIVCIFLQWLKEMKYGLDNPA